MIPVWAGLGLLVVGILIGFLICALYDAED